MSKSLFVFTCEEQKNILINADNLPTAQQKLRETLAQYNKLPKYDSWQLINELKSRIDGVFSTSD